MFGFNLTESQKGYLSLFIGIILLLQSFGLFTRWLGGIVFFYAIFLIVYGVLTTDAVKALRQKITKKRKAPASKE